MQLAMVEGLGRRQAEVSSWLEDPVQRLQQAQRVVEAGGVVGDAELEVQFLPSPVGVGVGDLKSQEAEKNSGIAVGTPDLLQSRVLRPR